MLIVRMVLNTCVGVIWGSGGGEGRTNVPVVFFLPKNSFLGGGRLSRRGTKNWVRMEKGGNYIKGWLKPNFPSFGLGFLLQLQFLIHMVDFTAHPHSIAT